ncbi:MAG: 4-carboxy-4-hydroxy-2-oxoadipate aldolase/oxaloacetate decarboxylase [Ruminiclostridium sp.]|nr:4-carboxy-4-hydroxy-2-oxoadipate aldolase/oxaloacetate decarboxylase [Ruminiclostridium sp.]
MPDIVRNYRKASKDILNAFSLMNAAALHESMGKAGALSGGIKAVRPGARVWGSALTVQCRPGDNLLIHKALSISEPGDVLVVTTGGYTEAGIWGEIMTVAAMVRGISGLVTDGSVRDTAAIQERGFPVFSRGISIKGTAKLAPGKINNPIVIGGVTVNPGDIIFGDDDGLVAIPPDKAEEVLIAARQREDRERIIMERLESGETTMDLLGLNEAFKRLALTEE